jgi:hypothetical protein
MPTRHNPWVKPRKVRSKTTSKRTCAMQRNAVQFKNVPNVSSATPTRRKRLLEQNQQWRAFMVDQPIKQLHRGCYVYKNGTIPRQTVAWLVEDYCKRQKVEYQTVFDCITASNGDIQEPTLVTTDDAGTVYINLLALDDPTLWRVYQQIPAHQQGAHPPPQRSPIVEVEVFWACCDNCSKWRRVPAKPEGECWSCSAILVSCDHPEDAMDDDEKWSGDVRGEQSSVLPSAVPSEAPESQGVEPANAPPDGDEDGDEDVNSVDLFGESGSENGVW